MKSHPAFERYCEAKSISRMLLASALIAVATSAWGCSYRVDTPDDWDSSPYASLRFPTGDFSDPSISIAYADLRDDSAVSRSGYTDPGWERVGRGSQDAGEAFSPANNNRVLEIPQAPDLDYTGAPILSGGDGE